ALHFHEIAGQDDQREIATVGLLQLRRHDEFRRFVDLGGDGRETLFGELEHRIHEHVGQLVLRDLLLSEQCCDHVCVFIAKFAMAHADRKAAGCYLFNSLIHLHMQLHELLAHYAGYDLWANHRFVERLEQETDELLDREVKSSFPSLRETVLHIRNAEHTWLCRIKGEAYQWPAEPETSI